MSNEQPYGAPPQFGTPPPAYGMPQYMPMGYGPPPAQNDALAIVSLVFGLIWMGGVGSIVAVITGHLSRSKAGQQGRPKSGLALAGLILGYLGIAGAALFWGGLIFAVSQGTTIVHSASDSFTRTDIRNASIAEETYYTDHQAYTQSLAVLESEASFVDDSDTYLRISTTATSYCIAGGNAITRNTFYLDSTHLERGVTTTPC